MSMKLNFSDLIIKIWCLCTFIWHLHASWHDTTDSSRCGEHVQKLKLYISNTSKCMKRKLIYDKWYIFSDPLASFKSYRPNNVFPMFVLFFFVIPGDSCFLYDKLDDFIIRVLNLSLYSARDSVFLTKERKEHFSQLFTGRINSIEQHVHWGDFTGLWN